MFKSHPHRHGRWFAAVALIAIVYCVAPDVRAAGASCPAAPDPIKNGFRSYQFKGVSAAVVDWTYKSYYSDQKEMDRLVGDLNAYRNNFGGVKTYHTITVDRITPNTSVFYVAAGHEKGELFFKFIYYCESDEWILSSRPQFDTDPDAIFSQDYYLRSIMHFEEASFTQK